jgi:hypothetical protein
MGAVAILSLEPGVAVQLATPGQILPIQFDMVGSNPYGYNGPHWGGFPYRRAMVQSVGVSSQGNQQYLMSLREFTYVYLFGEKPGKIVVSGYTVRTNCQLCKDRPTDPDSSAYVCTSGISETLAYYNSQRASKTCDHIHVTIGIFEDQAAFVGLLTGVRVEMLNPEGQIGQFSYEIDIFPHTVLGSYPTYSMPYWQWFV